MKSILKVITDQNEEVRKLHNQYQNATIGEKDILKDLDVIVSQGASENKKLKDIINAIVQDIAISKNNDPDDSETQIK